MTDSHGGPGREAANAGANVRVVLFGSPNGGAGQTAIATHVALGLARSGRRSLLLEAHRPSVAAHYWSASTAVAPATPRPDLRGEFGAIGIETHAVEGNLWHAGFGPHEIDRLAQAVRRLRSHATREMWLIVDLPRDLDRGRIEGLEADVEALVLRADPSSLLDLAAVRAQPEVMLVINQIDGRRRVSRDIDRVLSTLLRDRIAARVHYDEAVPEALALRANVYDTAPDSRAAQAFSDLVALLIRAGQPSAPIVASRAEH